MPWFLKTVVLHIQLFVWTVVFFESDTVEFAKKYASRVGHVHLKDVNMKSVPPVLARQQSIMEGVQKGLFTPLGQGDVPILETILALEAAGYQGWYVIEQDVAITGEMPGVGEGPISGMKESGLHVLPQLPVSTQNYKTHLQLVRKEVERNAAA